MRKIDKYLLDIHEALAIFKSNNQGYSYYEGKEGAKRLAREIGVAFRDFKREEALETIGKTYSNLCVRFYSLKPPISSKEWTDEMLKQLKL